MDMTRALSLWGLCLTATLLAAGVEGRVATSTCPAATPRGSAKFRATRAADLAGTFDLVLVLPWSAHWDSVQRAVLVLRPPDPTTPALRWELADSTRRVVGEQPAMWGYLAERTALYGAGSTSPDPARPGARLTAGGQLVIGQGRYSGSVALQVTHVTPTGFRGTWHPPPTITPGEPERGYFCANRR